MTNNGNLYDDGRVALDNNGMTIRWYCPWGGAKHIPYRVIRSFHVSPLSSVGGKWRIWGSGDFAHWYNLDGKRPSKQTGIEVDIGGRVRPTVTPDDADSVARILSERVAA